MENRQRTRFVSALILAVVFGAGVVVGMAFDRTATAAPAAETAEGTDEKEQSDREDRDRRSLYERVGELSEEQSTRIDSVVEEFRAAGAAMREEQELEAEPWRERWSARFDSLVQATRADIRAIMTAEQAERYDSLIADYEKRREEHRSERDSSGDRRD